MKRTGFLLLLGALFVLKGHCSPVTNKGRTMFGSTSFGEYPQKNQESLQDPGWWKNKPSTETSSRRPGREPLEDAEDNDLNELNQQITEDPITIDTSKVLNDIIDRLPEPARDLPLSNLTMHQITESVDYVIEILLQEFVPSECSKIVMAEFFLNALKKHIQLEFSPSRAGSLYTMIEDWSLTTLDTGEGEKPLAKHSIEAIVAIIYGPVMKRIDQLRKDFDDILQNVEQFFEVPRPELSSPYVIWMPLREALRALFAPFGTVSLSQSADCSSADVITDILHMSNDIGAYFQSYVADNFVILLSSNEPHLSDISSKSLLEYLKENYGMPGPILQIASLNMAPSDANELRWQCARAITELYFGGVLSNGGFSVTQVDNTFSSVELASLLEEYNNAMTLTDDKPTQSYISTLMAHHRRVLNNRGVTDISPMQILTTFCKILLDESESNGLNQTKLSMAIRQSLDRIGKEGIQTGSSVGVDSEAIGYTVDMLSGLLDVMKDIVHDITEVLPKQGERMTGGNNVTDNGTAS